MINGLNTYKIDHLMIKGYISNKKLKNLGWDIKIKFDNGLQNII